MDIKIVNADGSTISETATITVLIPNTNVEFDASGKEVYSGSENLIVVNFVHIRKIPSLSKWGDFPLIVP